MSLTSATSHRCTKFWPMSLNSNSISCHHWSSPEPNLIHEDITSYSGNTLLQSIFHSTISCSYYIRKQWFDYDLQGENWMEKSSHETVERYCPAWLHACTDKEECLRPCNKQSQWLACQHNFSNVFTTVISRSLSAQMPPLHGFLEVYPGCVKHPRSR